MSLTQKPYQNVLNDFSQQALSRKDLTRLYVGPYDKNISIQVRAVTRLEKNI